MLIVDCRPDREHKLRVRGLARLNACSMQLPAATVITVGMIRALFGAIKIVWRQWIRMHATPSESAAWNTISFGYIGNDIKKIHIGSII